MLISNYCPTSEMTPLLGGKFCGTKRMVGFFLFERGVKFAPNFVRLGLDDLIQEGKVIGVIAPDSLTDNNADATYSESTTLVRSQTNAGRKGWTFTFKKGNCFQNELNKLNNSDSWAFAPVLEDGSIILYKSASGDFYPFNAKTFVPIYNTPTNSGDDNSGAVLEVDLVGSLDQWQNKGQVVSATDFEWNEINPVAGIQIELPVIVTGATTTVATVSNLCSSAVIAGLTIATNWKMYRNGVPEAVTTVAYDATTLKYTFTHAAVVTGQEIYFKTEQDGLPIYINEGNYYTGQSETVIVVAS